MFKLLYFWQKLIIRKKFMKNDKINVLMGMDSYYPIVDGVSETMHNYLTEINKQHHKAIGLAPKIDKKYKDNFPYNIYRCKSIFIPIYNNCYPTPNLDRKLKKELNEQKIDIIHLHSPFAICKFGTKLAKKRCLPVVATFHTKFRPAFKEKLKSNRLTEMVMRKIGKAMNKMNEVFVANESIVEELRSYGYHGKVTYMPLGTEWQRNSDNATLNKIANTEFNIKAQEIVFIYVGRIEKVKNINFTLDALAELKKTFNNFKFLIVGTGIYLPQLKQEVEHKKLTENVIFTDFVERELLPAIYSRADVLLFPSPFDTLGLVKIEASAFNTPTLTIEDTCVSYGIKDNENGYLIKNTVKDYANKISEIIKDKTKLRQVGKNAGKTFYCSWEDASNKLLKRYTELIEENKEKYRIKKIGKLNEY